MEPLPARRALIVDAVIELLAEEGVRALTHRAIDERLGLPAGSTSYYFRTKAVLYEATIDELAARARDEARRVGPASQETPADAAQAAAMIARLVDRTLTTRRSETVARYALSLELAHDGALPPLLGTGAFSFEEAKRLATGLGCKQPAVVARGLVSLVEGLMFERCVGTGPVRGPRPGTNWSRTDIAAVLERYLRGAMAA